LPRISPAPPELYVPLFGENAPLRQQVYAHNPVLAAAFSQFRSVVEGNRSLPPRLVELVRLRIAFHNQCRSCMAVRYADAAQEVSEDLVCSLERPAEAPDLTDSERVAIEYGDLMATNHLAVGDEMYDRLREHFDESQIIELGMNVAIFVGFGRMAASLAMTEDLPERFRDDGTVTPWGEGDVIYTGGYAPQASPA
jgi:alkylhydroperoxidase family enzyme